MDSTSSSSSTASNKENMLTIGILGTLASIYVYLLLSPSQPHLSVKPRNFVIQRDTKEAFKIFYDAFEKSKSPRYETRGQESNYSHESSSKEWGSKGGADDFFWDAYKDDTFSDREKKNSSFTVEVGPNVPSISYTCVKGWLSIRAEINYKYLWMHAGENGWMGATATMDTPLHRKSYEMVPVLDSCEGGWVRLREADSPGFLMMIGPSGDYAIDEWVVKVGSSLLNETAADLRYHFLIENEGYLLNRGSMAFVNVLPQAEFGVRGHSSGWDRTKPADRSYGSMMHFGMINGTLVEESIAQEVEEIKESLADDELHIALISSYPKSTEKRVISFGLYGAKEKYTVGAVRNAELASTYFPGWICRYYITSDVPDEIVLALKALNAEINYIPKGMGYSSGMFWRFMVASDSSVDRFIVRDVDSRLNARDR